jgi:AcrR family transcriptional regulator
MATREYEQRLRAQTAMQTRQRILDAVYQRLRAAPAEPISVDQIARMAQVARSTVYLLFGSRAGLFLAVGTDLLRRGGMEDVLRAAAAADSRAALRETIHACVGMFAADRDVLRALSAMALLDGEGVGGAVRELEERRAAGMERLAGAGVLRADVTVEQAADVLCLLTSFASFDELYTGRSLPVEATAAGLAAIAERALCRPAG